MGLEATWWGVGSCRAAVRRSKKNMGGLERRDEDQEEKGENRRNTSTSVEVCLEGKEDNCWELFLKGLEGEMRNTRS